MTDHHTSEGFALGTLGDNRDERDLSLKKDDCGRNAFPYSLLILVHHETYPKSIAVASSLVSELI